MNTVIIGIAGGTGSGKTTLANEIRTHFGGNIPVISHDNYYRAQDELSAEELRRSSWYDILLFLTMMTEGTYREYEDDGLYRWAKTQFEEAWQEIHA